MEIHVEARSRDPSSRFFRSLRLRFRFFSLRFVLCRRTRGFPLNPARGSLLFTPGRRSISREYRQLSLFRSLKRAESSAGRTLVARLVSRPEIRCAI